MPEASSEGKFAVWAPSQASYIPRRLKSASGSKLDDRPVARSRSGFGGAIWQRKRANKVSSNFLFMIGANLFLNAMRLLCCSDAQVQQTKHRPGWRNRAFEHTSETITSPRRSNREPWPSARRARLGI